MIEKNVILFVRGEQQFDQGEPEVTELMTEGAMTLEEDGEITLTYQETELTGMEGTTTGTIRWSWPAPAWSTPSWCFSGANGTAPSMRPPGA